MAALIKNTDLILKNVGRYIALDSTEVDFFLDLLQPKILKRKKLYLKAGTVCKHSAFVLDGAVKSYTVDAEGKHYAGVSQQDTGAPGEERKMTIPVCGNLVMQGRISLQRNVWRR